MSCDLSQLWIRGSHSSYMRKLVCHSVLPTLEFSLTIIALKQSRSVHKMQMICEEKEKKRIERCFITALKKTRSTSIIFKKIIVLSC